jgi:hypothetical protein
MVGKNILTISDKSPSAWIFIQSGLSGLLIQFGSILQVVGKRSMVLTNKLLSDTISEFMGLMPLENSILERESLALGHKLTTMLKISVFN